MSCAVKLPGTNFGINSPDAAAKTEVSRKAIPKELTSGMKTEHSVDAITHELV